MATVCNLAKETGVSSFSRLIDVTTWLNFQDGFGVAYFYNESIWQFSINISNLEYFIVVESRHFNKLDFYVHTNKFPIKF